MKKWEYLVEHVHASEFQEWLNEHGADGWELVTATLDYVTWTAVMKRNI